MAVPKTIVLLADGTGNSSGALFRTNVWRLYQAIDQGPPSGGERQQIAYYHDGVGTSAFKPLAILGGAFGWGLKRNVLDLYTFLCRNYAPGDQIYAFGFSRGSFTIRLLTGLIVREGLLTETANTSSGAAPGAMRRLSERELSYLTRDAYRAYRRESFRHQEGVLGPVRSLRNGLRVVRDGLVRAWRALLRQLSYAAIAKAQTRVAFVGVWDTVAAYGLPLDELTHGIDKWVWPLSMPNYELSDRVDCARHALSLDDERNAFHPLLWDELHEQKLIAGKIPGKGKVAADRLRQVWFAGMHSDVGGGYPDDSLAQVPLDWMMTEAEAKGLRYHRETVDDIRRAANPCGPIHDSRRGLAGYYRYQPRKISAWLVDPLTGRPSDPGTLIMRNPRLDKGLLTAVHVHRSVQTRIARSADGYAPIVLPDTFAYVGKTGDAATAPEHLPAEAGRNLVWNLVWRKRIYYFATLAASLFLFALPFWQAHRPPPACTGPQCVLSPIIAAAGALLPGFAGWWIDAFALMPGTVVATIVVLSFILLRSASLQRRITGRMGALWRQSALQPGFLDPIVQGLRNSSGYQQGLRFLKWRALPTAFGFLVLALLAAVIVVPLDLVYERIRLVRDDPFCGGKYSGTAPPVRAGGDNDKVGAFATKDPCWATGRTVNRGERYRITLTVTDPWLDDTIPATPLGFGSDKFSGVKGYLFAPWRRSITGRWFQPFVAVLSKTELRSDPLEFKHTDVAAPTYVADFTPSYDGELFLYVNDALVRRTFVTERFLKDRLDRPGVYTFYNNNGGAAEVTIRRLPKEEPRR
jgi:uncharacterized protein (DUF2235 family)